MLEEVLLSLLLQPGPHRCLLSSSREHDRLRSTSPHHDPGPQDAAALWRHLRSRLLVCRLDRDKPLIFG